MFPNPESSTLYCVGLFDSATSGVPCRSGGPIGVTLNASSVMTPGKSISFLVGVGPEARVDHYFTQCRRCWMRDCAYRRAPATATVRR